MEWLLLVILLLLLLVLVLRACRQGVFAPTPPPPMAAPSRAPFRLRDARQAANVRRRVWIRYRHPDGQVSEGKVEIYSTTWNGHIRGWYCPMRSRLTLNRDRVLAWQILDEPFEPVKNMERWARWMWWLERMRHYRQESKRRKVLGP